ncbi:hypothetical protein MKW98_010227 [Papaver atlanticum]|uniref:KIB1-4 beta-propeller domain-containing protein n=1 Tax=Papaver atlanticum TaxID=357466 RepID=A0AAD4XF90_9MAGN|nr:hypothetical protein MKW98_010227 [Papaver atlanticum]
MGEESASIAASIERRSGLKTPPLPKAAPWLVVPYGKGKKNQAFYNICEPNNRNIRKSIPELNGKKFWQKPSHKGWLIILCHDKSYDYTPQWNYGDFFLWNPSSFETVQLPSLLHWIDKPKQYELVDCVLSSPPTLTNSRTKCYDSMVFFAIYNWSGETSRYVFLYCNPEDQQWRSEEVSQDSPRSPLSLHYLRDKLYAMENMHSRLEIEIQNKDDNNANLCIRRFEPGESTDFPCGGSSYTCLFQIHFMESCDEIYRIDMCQSLRNHREIYSILVARLDFSLLEWKEVKKFGDLVLFRGQNSTACCSASELGLTNGCLYYTLPGDLSLYKFELPNCIVFGIEQSWPGRISIYFIKRGEQVVIVLLGVSILLRISVRQRGGSETAHGLNPIGQSLNLKSLTGQPSFLSKSNCRCRSAIVKSLSDNINNLSSKFVSNRLGSLPDYNHQGLA